MVLASAILYMQNSRMGPIQRLTAPTVEVLRVLLDAQTPVWGLRVAKIIGRPPGSVYPILARLEECAWVVAQWDDDDTRVGPRRRLYALTESGATEAPRAIAAWNARVARPSRRTFGTAHA